MYFTAGEDVFGGIRLAKASLIASTNLEGALTCLSEVYFLMNALSLTDFGANGIRRRAIH